MEETMQGQDSPTRPLVLLDVDGVINDLGALYGSPRPWRIHKVLSNGFVLHIPDYMPALIRDLVENAEVWWCTTWRDRANDELAAHLGINRLSVIDDGSRSRNVGWKPAAAHSIACAALADGREVFWIEDFYGDVPTSEMPAGVVFVDTAEETLGPVLTAEMLPTGLCASAQASPSIH
jgi:hypothetical protein